MQFIHRERQRHERAGDGRRARAAVGLQHVAIHADGACADFFQVNRRADGAADEPLDFRRPAVELALGNVARLARQGGVGKHRVFGGDPAALDFLFLHPARDGFLDGDAADDAGAAPFDERGAGGVRRDMVLETQWTKLVGGAPVGADGFRHGRHVKLQPRHRATRKTKRAIFGAGSRPAGSAAISSAKNFAQIGGSLAPVAG